jgi:hypothetical protein
VRVIVGLSPARRPFFSGVYDTHTIHIGNVVVDTP